MAKIGWMFDSNTDTLIDHEDHVFWIHDLKHTGIGDPNLDGLFNSNDLIDVLAANTYENDIAAGWAQGDFNGSGRFEADDLMDALTDSGYVKRLRPLAVPEPGTLSLAAMAGMMLLLPRKHSR